MFKKGFKAACGAYVGWHICKGIDRGFGKFFAPYLDMLSEWNDERDKKLFNKVRGDHES